MTPGSAACPNCGLKLRQTSAPVQPPQAQPPQAQPPQVQPTPGHPTPLQRQTGGSGLYSSVGFQNGPEAPPPQPPPTGAFAPGAPAPGAPSSPYAFSASSDAYAQPSYMSPGESPPPPPLPPLRGQGAPGPVKSRGESSGKLVPILIGAIVLAVVVVGILAVTVMGKKTVSGPEATVQKFFTEMSSGNVSGMLALCTPDHQPTQDQVAMLQSMFGSGGIFKMSDFKTSVSNLTATSATVTVDDATMSAMGQSKKLSEIGQGGKMKFNLVLSNGQWLINDSKGG